MAHSRGIDFDCILKFANNQSSNLRNPECIPVETDNVSDVPRIDILSPSLEILLKVNDNLQFMAKVLENPGKYSTFLFFYRIVVPVVFALIILVGIVGKYKINLFTQFETIYTHTFMID